MCFGVALEALIGEAARALLTKDAERPNDFSRSHNRSKKMGPSTYLIIVAAVGVKGHKNVPEDEVEVRPELEQALRANVNHAALRRKAYRQKHQKGLRAG